MTMIVENLRQNDLEHLVSPYVSIDQYTSKIAEDNITIALFCNEKEVAQDLYDYLEKLYYIEIRDIEISDTLTEDNKYIIYVELDRTNQFPKILLDMIDSINFLINKEVKDWDFVSFGMEHKEQLSVENLKKYIRLKLLTSNDMVEKPVSEPSEEGSSDKEKEEKSETDKEDVKQESVQYSLDNITRTYLDEGFITEKEFTKLMETSDLDMSMCLDKEVLEHNFPQCEIITTTKNAFIIADGKIKKLGF